MPDAVTWERSLKGYHLLPAVRGDVLAKVGRFDVGRPEFERAVVLTVNARDPPRMVGGSSPKGNSIAMRCR